MVVKIIMIVCLALVVIGLLMLLWCDYELEKMQIEEGDIVRILDFEFEYTK